MQQSNGGEYALQRPISSCTLETRLERAPPLQRSPPVARGAALQHRPVGSLPLSTRSKHNDTADLALAPAFLLSVTGAVHAPNPAISQLEVSKSKHFDPVIVQCRMRV